MLTASMSDTKLLKLSGDGDGDGDGDWIVDAELPDGRLVIRPAPMGSPARAGEVTFPVVVDHRPFDEDLAHSTPAARAVAKAAARRLERHGASAAILRPCQAQARDGTQLPG
jgi:hypothetical protein